MCTPIGSFITLASCYCALAATPSQPSQGRGASCSRSNGAPQQQAVTGITMSSRAPASPPAFSPMAVPRLNLVSEASPAGAAAEGPAGCQSPTKRPHLPLLALPSSCSFTRTPSTPSRASVPSNGADSSSGHASGPLQALCSAAADAAAPGRCRTWQLLVELLMVNSSMGRAAVLQDLAETQGNRLLPHLQQAVRPHVTVTVFRFFSWL